MDKIQKDRLEAICSSLEPKASSVASDLADNIDDGLGKIDDQQAFLDEVKVATSRRAYNYLNFGTAEKEEETAVGFAFNVRENEKSKLLEEAICEVKKRGLLKKTLGEMARDNWPLSEDEKIIMLLSFPAEMPVFQRVIDATLSIPILNLSNQLSGVTTKRGKAKTAYHLPVQVVLGDNNQIIDILLRDGKQRN